jgi:hypothetical protein
MVNTATKYELKRINEFTYSLKMHGEYNIYLYDTIKHLIHTSHIDYDTNTFFFSAETVLPLNALVNTFTYNQCIELIDDLSKQLFYIRKKGFAPYGFDITDILTIDGTFIFCSTQYLLPLDEENEAIIFTYPINRPYFSNPEVFKLTSLPTEINHKCGYYSLGLLIVFLLLKTKLDQIEQIEQIENVLVPLYNTKIYWFLKRCLDEDVYNRQLLLV